MQITNKQVTDNIESYTYEDIQGTTVVKKCTACKLVVFIGKSQDVDKSTNTVNKVFEEKHLLNVNCPDIFEGIKEKQNI